MHAGIHPPGLGLDTPGCGPGQHTPPPYPPTSPLGVGLETPPQPDPSTSPLGMGLDTPHVVLFRGGVRGFIQGGRRMVFSVFLRYNEIRVNERAVRILLGMHSC